MTTEHGRSGTKPSADPAGKPPGARDDAGAGKDAKPAAVPPAAGQRPGKPARSRKALPTSRPEGAPQDPWTAFATTTEGEPGRFRRGLRKVLRGLVHEYALVTYAALIIAVAMTWPTLQYPLHTVPQDVYDPARQAWQISWLGHILLTDPVRLWQSNAYFPEPYSFVWGDSLLGYAPFGMLGEGPLAAVLRYNILFVLAHALLVIGGYALVRQLGAGRTGAAVGAIAFAYAPWRLAQAGHLDIISAGGIPLALAMLARGHGWSMRYGYRPGKRHAGWAAAGWLVATWQVSLGFSLGVPFAGVLAGILVVIAIAVPIRRRREAARRAVDAMPPIGASDVAIDLDADRSPAASGAPAAATAVAGSSGAVSADRPHGQGPAAWFAGRRNPATWFAGRRNLAARGLGSPTPAGPGPGSPTPAGPGPGSPTPAGPGPASPIPPNSLPGSPAPAGRGSGSPAPTGRWPGNPVLGWRLIVTDVLGALVLAGVGALLAVPYFRFAGGTGNSTTEIAFFSPPVRSLLIGPAESRIWGAPHEVPRSSLGWPAEMTLLPGFVLYAFALAGLFFSIWKVWQRLVLILALAAAVVLTLGTTFFGGRWTYLPIFGHLPASLGLRIPGRLMLWVTLLLAVLAAGAVAEVVRRAEHMAAQRIPPWPGPWLRLATLVPLLLVLGEAWNAIPHPVVPDQPAAMRTVTGPMLVLPTAALGDQTVQLWSTTRFQPVVNGAGGFAVARQTEMRQRVSTFPDPASIEYLRGLGVGTVLLVRSEVAGTPWERTGDIPVDALGIRREDLEGAVVFYLS